MQYCEFEPATYLDLAARYGTPLFVYDGDALAAGLDELRSALPPRLEVFYSLKANPNISVVSLLAELGARAEVCSLVELRTAIAAGVAPGDIIFLGPGKSLAELRACVTAGIYAVVVESFGELTELADICAVQGRRQRVLLRVNPTTSAPGGALTMGGKPRQFGIDEAQLLASGPLPNSYPDLDICGVHVYVGTRIRDAELVVENTRRNLELAERVAAATGIRLDAVDVGGGLGVAYFADETDPELGQLAAGLAGVVADFASRHSGTRLLFEAGRYLTARAGQYLIGVRYVKESGDRQFAVTDGGSHQHSAAAGVGSYLRRNFPVRLISRTSDDTSRPCTVTGPLCTPNDTVLKDVALPPLRPGDVLAIGRSGAYAATASPGLFLSHGYAAEVLLRDGRDYLVRDRDQPVDLIRKQHFYHFGGRPMERTQLIEQVRIVISRVTSREIPELDENTELAQLGLDSTGMLEMLMNLEDLGSFEVDPDELEPALFVSVGTLVDYMTKMAKVP